MINFVKKLFGRVFNRAPVKRPLKYRTTETEWAYYWVSRIGDNKEIMHDRVTESMWPYWWFMNLSDQGLRNIPKGGYRV
jgi:hypothetical protein